MGIMLSIRRNEGIVFPHGIQKFMWGNGEKFAIKTFINQTKQLARQAKCFRRTRRMTMGQKVMPDGGNMNESLQNRIHETSIYETVKAPEPKDRCIHNTIAIHHEMQDFLTFLFNPFLHSILNP